MFSEVTPVACFSCKQLNILDNVVAALGTGPSCWAPSCSLHAALFTNWLDPLAKSPRALCLSCEGCDDALRGTALAMPTNGREWQWWAGLLLTISSLGHTQLLNSNIRASAVLFQTMFWALRSTLDPSEDSAGGPCLIFVLLPSPHQFSSEHILCLFLSGTLTSLS